MKKKILSLGIDKKWQQFLEYLQSEKSLELFKKNKLTIHVETGSLFFDNINTNESIYDFFLAQQDYPEKPL